MRTLPGGGLGAVGRHEGGEACSPMAPERHSRPENGARGVGGRSGLATAREALYVAPGASDDVGGRQHAAWVPFAGISDLDQLEESYDDACVAVGVAVLESFADGATEVIVTRNDAGGWEIESNED